MWRNLEELLNDEDAERGVWTREELDDLVYTGKKVEGQQDALIRKESNRGREKG